MTVAFIVGTGRCGSTLVQEVLSRHEGVGFVSNVDNALPWLDLKGRANNPVYRLLPTPFSGRTTSSRRAGWGGSEAGTGGGLARLVERRRLYFAPSEGYRLIDRRVSPFVTAPDRDLVAGDAGGGLGARFRRLFLDRALAQGRPVFLHHFTGWPRVGFIQAAIPGTRFVHVVRDGRAVAASLARASWWRGRDGPEGWGLGPLSPPDREAWEASGRSPELLAGLEWKLLLASFDRAEALVAPERWLTVRYEDVVAEPRSAVERLLAFLGLGWTDGFERQFGRCSFDPTRTAGFRDELPPEELGRLDLLLGERLSALGYLV